MAMITSMEQPLGHEVGNANEIQESIEVLLGRGPDDLTELTLATGEIMLDLAGIEGGRSRLEDSIADRSALAKFEEVTAAQGGDIEMIRDPSLLPRAPNVAQIKASSAGYVQRCDALTIGTAATMLGAGREQQDDEIDPGVGITVKAKVGDDVSENEVLAEVRYSEESRWRAQREFLAGAWSIGAMHVDPPRLIVERVDP